MKKIRPKENCAFGLVTLLALLSSTFITAAQQTNAISPNDFQSFHIISERNIFNASRSGQIPRKGRQRVAKVDYFKLLGTMSYEKGRFAIFGGSSTQFRKIIQPSGLIGDYKVADIAPDCVKLSTTNGQVIAMNVGMQIRREDNGPWALSSLPEPAPDASASAEPSTTTSGTAPTASSGAESDILKRLMQKREQELKK